MRRIPKGSFMIARTDRNRSRTRDAITRRDFLSFAAASVAMGLAGCGGGANPGQSTAPTATRGSTPTEVAPTSSLPTMGPAVTESPRGNSIVVFFSRAGENYDSRSSARSGTGRPITTLTVGNTEVLAGYLAELLNCPTHKLEAADPYPGSYDETVARNVRELNEDARPAISNPLTSLEGYSTVLIGSPIWAQEAPRIMRTFIDANDFSGITVAPFVTYAVSGIGGVPGEYQQACRGAQRITGGLAVNGETVQGSRDQAAAWLRQIGLL